MDTRPLNQPGQSIRHMNRDRMANEIARVACALLAVGMIGGIAAGVLITRLVDIGNIAAFVILGISVLLMCGIFVWANRIIDANIAQEKNDALGVQGERVVADALDDLKRDGYRVFHDVPPERKAREGEKLSNYDHIVIGPTGVYVIETKARTKRDSGNEIVVQANGRVLVNGREPDRCPIGQVTLLRDKMKTMLEQQTRMRDMYVRGAVIFPEWFIKDAAYRRAGGDIWTLNETAFIKWVRNPKYEPVRLNADQIKRLSECIENHVRNQTS